MFKQSIKIIGSIVLTSILATTAIYAFTVSVPKLKTGDVVTSTHWNTIADNFENVKSTFLNKSQITTCGTWEVSKFNGTKFVCIADQSGDSLAIPSCGEDEFLSANSSGFICKTFTDKTLDRSDVMATVVWGCKVCLGWADRGGTVPEKEKCVPFNDAYKYVNTDGDVNGDDNFFIKVQCSAWDWSSPSVSNTSTSCGSKRTTNNQKSWACYQWSTNIYYGGEQTCTYIVDRWRWEPMDIPWFKYSKKYTQTCN